MRGQVKPYYSIGIDILGGDASPELFIEPILSSAQKWEGKARLVVFGTSTLFKTFPNPPANIDYYEVEECITMEDSPLVAIRKKKNSSLCTAIRLVKEGILDACISSGNTGALVAASQIILGSLPHISRPALIALIPTRQEKKMAVLDVGASWGSKENYFLELALMGIAYQKSRGIKCPRVGLLNVGTEIQKGTGPLQKAYSDLLALSQRPEASFSFAGNREGRDVFSGELDVLVTDGFTGNVFLKTAEGIAAALIEQLEMAQIHPSTLSSFRSQLHYKEHPGSLLCGVQGVVMKCHGNASPKHIVHSTAAVIELLETAFLQKLSTSLQEIRI